MIPAIRAPSAANGSSPSTPNTTARSTVLVTACPAAVPITHGADREPRAQETDQRRQAQNDGAHSSDDGEVGHHKLEGFHERNLPPRRWPADGPRN